MDESKIWTNIIHSEISLDGPLSLFQECSYDDTQTESYKDYTNVAHGMLYSRDSTMMKLDVKDNIPRPKHALILMQMRFDGSLGFPGGMVDHAPEIPVEGLNRELQEEINLDTSLHGFKHPENHMVTHVRHDKKLLLHFYAMEVSVADFSEIERRHLTAVEWGHETLGMIRVPLTTIFPGTNSPAGFPKFLTNNFAGNAKLQLIYSMLKLKILPQTEMDRLMEIYQEYSRSQGK